MAETDQGQSSSQGSSSEQGSRATQGGAASGSAAGAAAGAAGGIVDEARDVASRLGASAKELTSEVARSAQDMVKGEVGKRTEKGAEDLSQVAHALRRSGRDLDDNLAAPYVERVADQIERASDYLRTAEPAQMLTTVQNFARREPALFLGGAFAIGFLGARFMKSSSRAEEEMGSGGVGSGVGLTSGISGVPRNYPSVGENRPSGGAGSTGSGGGSGRYGSAGGSYGAGSSSTGGTGTGSTGVRSGQGSTYGAGGSTYGAGSSGSSGGSTPGATGV